MTTRILNEAAASISELKANPMKMVLSADGEPIAVLNRNEPAFYCIPADTYTCMIGRIEELELMALAEALKSEKAVMVDINDL